MLIFRDLVEQALQALFRAIQLFVEMLALVLFLHHLLTQDMVFFAKRWQNPTSWDIFCSSPLSSLSIGQHYKFEITVKSTANTLF